MVLKARRQRKKPDQYNYKEYTLQEDEFQAKVDDFSADTENSVVGQIFQNGKMAGELRSSGKCCGRNFKVYLSRNGSVRQRRVNTRVFRSRSVYAAGKEFESR